MGAARIFSLWLKIAKMKSDKQVILFVDQSPVVLQRMVPLLEALPNVEVVVHAGSYKEAMTLLGGIRPHMILMDIDLPEGRGIELLKTVRERYENIVVFITTNFVTEQYRSLCQRLGARQFFDKSGDIEQLTDAVA